MHFGRVPFKESALGNQAMTGYNSENKKKRRFHDLRVSFFEKKNMGCFHGHPFFNFRLTISCID